MSLSYEIAHTSIQSTFTTAFIYVMVIVQTFAGPDIAAGLVLLSALFGVKLLLFIIFRFILQIQGSGQSVLLALISSMLVTFIVTATGLINIGIEWYWLFGILLFTDLIARLIIYNIKKESPHE